MKKNLPYHGLEQGPIRPPSEADSLCLRITRNCPWNHCTFCSLYKDEGFSLRSVEDVIQDIDTVHRYIKQLREITSDDGLLPAADIHGLRATASDQTGFMAALNWYAGGMESVFLQDANGLVIKPANLTRILEHLKLRFPQIRRITSYARSKTIAKMKPRELKTLREAGLDRIHIGMESGSDRVLAIVKKGSTQAMHIIAGIKVKEAGMELSEYFMPGLGGRDHSREHALESASVLNRIDPDFIRLRTLVIPPRTPLHEAYRAGRFKKCTDPMVVREIQLFVENLNGISSTLTSDHIVNLLPEIQGKLPRDKDNMLHVSRAFLAADPERQALYRVGRRCGFLSRLETLDDPGARANARAACRELGITGENLDAVTDALLQRYI